MLEIRVKRRRWPRIVISIILIIVVTVGGYVLVTYFSPSLPILSGKSGNETKDKLAKPVGTYGDRLYLPKLNVDVAILQGKDSNALDKGAWNRRPENGDPIKGGNFVLSARRFVLGTTPQATTQQSPFYNISELRTGDHIFVDFKSKRYEYVISEAYAVKPKGVAVEVPTNEPQLTLYSCGLDGESDGRDVLEAKPIKKDED